MFNMQIYQVNYQYNSITVPKVLYSIDKCLYNVAITLLFSKFAGTFRNEILIKIIKGMYYWPLLRMIHCQLLDSPYKDPMMQPYGDVIMSVMAFQITILMIVCSTFIQVKIKGNIKALCHWPLCREFTGDRWIPRTKGQ